jgi:hypothetical protein
VFTYKEGGASPGDVATERKICVERIVRCNVVATMHVSTSWWESGAFHLVNGHSIAGLNPVTKKSKTYDNAKPQHFVTNVSTVELILNCSLKLLLSFSKINFAIKGKNGKISIRYYPCTVYPSALMDLNITRYNPSTVKSFLAVLVE